MLHIIPSLRFFLDTSGGMVASICESSSTSCTGGRVGATRSLFWGLGRKMLADRSIIMDELAEWGVPVVTAQVVRPTVNCNEHYSEEIHYECQWLRHERTGYWRESCMGFDYSLTRQLEPGRRAPVDEVWAACHRRCIWRRIGCRGVGRGLPTPNVVRCPRRSASASHWDRGKN